MTKKSKNALSLCLPKFLNLNYLKQSAHRLSWERGKAKRLEMEEYGEWGEELYGQEEERDEYGPMHTDEYEVKEGILKMNGQRAHSGRPVGPKWTVTVRPSWAKLNESWSNWTIKATKSGSGGNRLYWTI